MIVSRAPVRFSLGGGGTDLPAYAERFGGFVVATAIDKYVFVAARRRYDRAIRLSYSKTEIADALSEIEHPIFREALASASIHDSIELVSVADLPAQSGLGSSGTFTVALL
ncbi:MAG TPA: sugar kinase, partial [Polyangiaceae bacterium]|nr:sugar kinase [Polyangiaceae bacterium]